MSSCLRPGHVSPVKRIRHWAILSGAGIRNVARDGSLNPWSGHRGLKVQEGEV